MVQKKRILVVEDNELNRAALGEILSGEYEVLEAENGQEALEVLHHHKGSVALILLDVMMPVMDGYTFLDQVKADQELSLIPVIVMTQSDSEEDEVAALAQTFNSMAANIESIDRSRSQFMGNIAHELRTPMTSIKGFVDGMLDGTIPPELQHHYLEVVSQESGRLARLVQNMLDITRLEAGEYKVNAQDYDVWHTITGVFHSL